MYLRSTTAAVGSFLGATTLVLTCAVPAQAVTVGDPLPVAHRGASAYAPENTLAAVDKARELGIRWVENDVQRTKDGELIVIHDTTLNRTTNVEELFPDRSPWRVADFTSEEIATLDAGSWFSDTYAGEKVPTLEQFLDRMSEYRQKLLLEIKQPALYPGIEKDILAELSDEGWLDAHHVKSKLIVQSFDAGSVQTVHTLRPPVKTGFLGAPDVSELPLYGEFADQINPRYTDLSASYVDEIHSVMGAHDKPLEVFTWTVNDGATAVKVTEMGVDGIISNAPDVVRDAVRD